MRSRTRLSPTGGPARRCVRVRVGSHVETLEGVYQTPGRFGWCLRCFQAFLDGPARDRMFNGSGPVVLSYVCCPPARYVSRVRKTVVPFEQTFDDPGLAGKNPHYDCGH